MLGVRLTKIGDTITHHIEGGDHPRYSIITLNYDMVIENVLEYLQVKVLKPGVFFLNRESKGHIQNYDKYGGFSYAKIHGTLDPLLIIPMTWNKTSTKDIQNQYEFAHHLLSGAKEIRFIGYSLPEADNHLKYLFINGLMGADNLQKIDVICLDDDGIVEKRYGKLFSFRDLRFKNINVLDYMTNLCSYNSSEITYDRLEEQHSRILSE